MQKLWVILLALGLSACGGSGSSGSVGGLAPGLVDTSTGGGTGTGGNVDQCSNEGQKQFVLEAMNFWYFWNDSLPSNVNIDDFATPDALLAFLSSFSPDDGSGSPIDRFSFLTTAAADQAFFGEGQFEGYGFGSRFDSADELRLTRVFAGSPAADAGFERGQQIVALNGRSIADVEAAEGFDGVLSTGSVEFTMKRLDDTEFTVTVQQDTVTIDPVPQYRIIDNNGTPTGYLQLETFISTADDQLDAAFADFIGAGVQDLILDMRYNGGGLVNTAELLGDLLGGAIVPQGLIFSETRFNADRADNNFNELFEIRPNSLSLARLAVIASQNTASASELVTNSMEPAADVVIVGDRTFGKPVGQIGIEFCDLLLRPTAFQTLNGEGFGDYFNGLPADFLADDDLSTEQGGDNDPNVIAALSYFATGNFPTTRAPDGPATASLRYVRPETATGGSPARAYAGAR